MVALAAGGVLGSIAALIETVVAYRGQGYWTSGAYRLLAARVSEAFDPWAAGLAAGVVVLSAAVRVWRGGAGRGRVAAIVALGLVLGARLLAAADAWRASRGPNVLLISIDTLRADALGAYGQQLPTSPAVDRRLAGEGVLFEQCFSQSPKTTPSHMTLLTSLYPPVHGVEMWEDATARPSLNPAVRTLAEVLKNAGYATAGFTAGAHVHRSRGFGDGFDVYKHGNQVSRAVEWMQAHRGRKFFVFFHTYQVHDPYVPPKALIARFVPGFDGPVREVVDRLRAGQEGGWEEAHKVFWANVDAGNPRDVEFVNRLYHAGVRHMDDTTVTTLLDQLDALDLARETLVVFTSDHGEAFHEHGIFLHEDLYAETLHVPLVLRFPGRLPAGQRVAGRVRTIDVMPTILDVLGVVAPEEIQGRSLVPLVRGTADGGPPVVSDYSSTEPARVFQSLRGDGVTYIVDGPAEHLFDTHADPAEQRDLAPSEPAKLTALREELTQWRAGVAPLADRLRAHGTAAAPSAETMRQLRALGYVE